jgi:hypothetical protein
LPSPSSNVDAENHHMITESKDDPATSPRQSRRWDEGRPIY